MCMKSQLLRQNTSGLLPVLNIDFTIFNIFCTAFLSLLWYISQLCLTDLHRNIPWHKSVSPFLFGFLLGFSKNFSISSLQQLQSFDVLNSFTKYSSKFLTYCRFFSFHIIITYCQFLCMLCFILTKSAVVWIRGGVHRSTEKVWNGIWTNIWFKRNALNDCGCWYYW